MTPTSLYGQEGGTATFQFVRADFTPSFCSGEFENKLDLLALASLNQVSLPNPDQWVSDREAVRGVCLCYL